PRTINAFAAWRASGRGAAVALPAALDRAAAGASAFEAVYGDRADRVRAELARLHPDLERAVIEDAYGRTLSRPVLSLRVKELVAVPVLIATDAPKQLASHVAGARRAGADDAEILEAAEQAKARCARGAFAPAISRVREALAKG
ncbi:MAG TPA: carboxymuconolactone decarboxylase family protein, partial [Planctomycetota bacterium]|nr:carboxymuconolactone decarboxylase family protein [Planctomycetota bacterium]